MTERFIGWREVALLGLGLMTVLTGASLAPALPQMAEHFRDVSGATFMVKFSLTLPAFFIALGAPVAGYCVDRWGRRPVLLFSLALTGLAGSAGFFLDTLDGILLSRGLLGCAVAGTLTTTVTLVGDYFSGADRSRYLAIQSSTMSSSGVVFLLAGGWLATISWRAPFLLFGIAFLLLPLAYMKLVEPTHHQKTGHGKLPGLSVTIRTLAPLYLIAATYMGLFYLVPVEMPFLLEKFKTLTPAGVGAIMACFAFSGAVSASQYGRMRKRFEPFPLFAFSFGLMGTGYLFLSVTSSYGSLFPGLILSGLGFGQVTPNISLWLVEGAPPSIRGKAAGGLTASLFTGQFFSPLISHTLSTPGDSEGIFRGGALGLFLLTFTFLVAARPKR